MQELIKQLEEVLDVKLEVPVPYQRQTLTITNNDLTLNKMNELVKQGKIIWQDETDPHCGNNDGIWYFMLPTDATTFLAIDPTDSTLCYC